MLPDIAKQREKKGIIISIILIALYLSPLFILGENAHIRVHDNMDSNITWYKVLKNSGEIFGSLNSTIPQIINGLPRNAFGTEFSGIIWLHYFFSPMIAYAISQSITRIFAFLGMYLLLKKHFVKDHDLYWIRLGVSLAFALTPFWPSGMLSTLGQPLALWAFLNIRNKDYSWKNWLVLTLLPLYSSFVLGFFFFLVAMGLLWLVDFIFNKRRMNVRFLLSIVYMTILYLAIEYRLVGSLVFGESPTSRNEFVSSKLGFWHTIRLLFKNFTLGHTHVMTLHTFIILPVLIIVLSMIFLRGDWKKEKRFVYLFVLNFVLSTWYAFWFYKGWEPLKERFSILNTFNFSRFHFLRPLIIYLSFGLGLAILWKKYTPNMRKLLKILIVLQILILFGFNEEIKYRVVDYPSFKQFYSEHLFTEVKDYIGKPQSTYRVASIGLHPAIAQYNGFYTLDTYNNYYPLTYKHQFRKIIAKELDKNKTIQTYFDQWGNRVYLFSAELGKKYDFRKDSSKQIKHLDLNTKMFKEMGGEYIFSSVPILNAKENHLKLLKSFQDTVSVWKVYLYKVNM